MKRLIFGLLAALLIILTGCVVPQGGIDPDPQAGGMAQWHYAKGPNGEKCLVVTYIHGIAIHCDTVNWPVE